METHGPESSEPLLAAAAPVIEDEAVISFGSGPPQVVTVLAFDSLLLLGAPVESALRSGIWTERFGDFMCGIPGLGVRNMLGLGSTDYGSERSVMVLRAPIRGMKLSRYKERAFQRIELIACDVFSINADLDSRYILAPLEAGRSLFHRSEAVSRFELSLLPGWTEETATEVLRASLNIHSIDATVRPRSEKNQLITRTNRAEKWATFVILSFILIVAAFNVMASLTMLLLDKKNDMEVLHAMGLSGVRLERVFALQGVLINAAGGTIGLVLGVLLVWGQQTFGWVKLQGSVIPAYPVALQWTDAAGTLLVVVVVGGVGSGWMVKKLVQRLLQR